MPLRILVVEDLTQFRHLICTELQRRAEFEIFEEADGLEGVQKAVDLQPDLVLLDIGLPKLHGFEVAKQIRTLAPSDHPILEGPAAERPNPPPPHAIAHTQRSRTARRAGRA
jgi:DNA-binding response OmpR family regulator